MPYYWTATTVTDITAPSNPVPLGAPVLENEVGAFGARHEAGSIDVAGFDTLTLVGRGISADCFFADRWSRRNGRIVPGLMSFGTEAVKRSAADQVSLDVEDVVDGGVDGDETLS